MIRAILILISFLILSCNRPPTLDIATFNIAWLGDGVDDKKPRTSDQYQNIARTCLATGAEIIALQEIENKAALDSILQYMPDFKSLILPSDRQQNCAFLMNANIDCDTVLLQNNITLNNSRLRPGLLARISTGTKQFWLLNIHLKSTSRFDSTPELREKSYSLRCGQAETLSNWADSMAMAGESTIILGDCNDSPTRKRCSLSSLFTNNNLKLLTADLRSCKFKYLMGIDHIMVSKDLYDNLLPNSVMLFNQYKSLTDTEAANISDHCPVKCSIEF